MKPIAMDLFCKAGGATKGLQRAGFYVIGVDIEPQPHYCGDEFIQADALTVPLRGDFIWASPPCQAHTTLKVMWNIRKHADLIPATRRRLLDRGGLWAMENVNGAPLINPLQLCGSNFGLRTTSGAQLRRHRYFECSFPVGLWIPCSHAARTIGIFGDKARDLAKEKRHYGQPKASRGKPEGIQFTLADAREAMGIDWMNMAELSQAIPPAYSEYVGRMAAQILERAA